MLVCGDFNTVPTRSGWFSYLLLPNCTSNYDCGHWYPIKLTWSSFKMFFSAPHSLLAMGKIDPLHPDLMVDPLGILRPHTKLTHQLPLVIIFPKNRKGMQKNRERHTENYFTLWAMQVSAYSSFARMGGSLIAEQQRRTMDPTSNEPLFTNCTRDFIGTLDYIFYTG